MRDLIVIVVVLLAAFLLDLYKKKTTKSRSKPSASMEVYQTIFAEMAKESPSRHFVAGTVFEAVRQHHGQFEHIVRSKDGMNALDGLRQFLISAYLQYLEDPGTFGGIPQIVNKANNDTDPGAWNFTLIPLDDNDVAALCFMPIQNDKLMARIVGIVIGNRGDGYYYCMLNKDQSISSDVIRNKAMAGIEKVGKVKGAGFDLMNSFTDCIRTDYYK